MAANLIISEVNITPVKPKDGLVAFASFVINDSIYCGSVGILSRPTGGYRLVYPTKQIGFKQHDIFHPISNQAGRRIEAAVLSRYEEVMKKGYVGYDNSKLAL